VNASQNPNPSRATVLLLSGGPNRRAGINLSKVNPLNERTHFDEGAKYPRGASPSTFLFGDYLVSHPQNFFIGCTDFQSSISKCPHEVYSPLGSTVKSSACSLCNSALPPRPMLTEKQLAKQIAKIEKIVPPFVEEFTETNGEEDQELNEESNFEAKENTEAYREEAEIEVEG
jgi:hypothetical protein